LYALHDEHRTRGRLLRSIGVARIIEAAVPIADLGMWQCEVIVRRFLSARGIKQSGLKFSDRTRSPVPADKIKRIVSRSDALFEALTGCSTWRPPLG
jgi:hypothetical protein